MSKHSRRALHFVKPEVQKTTVQQPVNPYKPLVATPSYDGNVHYMVMGALMECKDDFPRLALQVFASSFLTYNFNKMWSTVLNEPSYTHFVMLHADITPITKHWLGTLINEMEIHGADMISAVSPIKTPDGTTSTAIARHGEFGNFRRVTVYEALNELPQTFGVAEVANLFGWDASTSWLLANTGMMVVNMKNRSIMEQMVFDVGNWIKKDSEGKYSALSEPEDWRFSRELQEKGLKVLSTTAVKLSHLGNITYTTNMAWGMKQHDFGG